MWRNLADRCDLVARSHQPESNWKGKSSELYINLVIFDDIWALFVGSSQWKYIYILQTPNQTKHGF
jgi:hypothetical protein